MFQFKKTWSSGEEVMADFQSFMTLKKLLMLMEGDLGIDGLKHDERDVLAAIIDVQNDDGSFASDILKTHHLIRRLSPSTFFRSLLALREKGFIEKCNGRERNLYRLLPEKSH